MKILSKYSNKLGLLVVILTVISGCERKLSDEAVLPSFDATAEIFTDNFIGMGSDFYFPFASAKPDVFSVDITEGYQSNASIRIDVPNANDPTGAYAGAIFRTQGPGRDLSGYDALTFYVKASTGVSLGSAGFGINYNGDKYQVTASNINVSTNWTKVTIPIPDASVLLQERGLFWFSSGTQGTNGSGYTLWFDEIKFEKLGTIGVLSSSIFNGNDLVETGFSTIPIPITGLSHTVSLPSGLTQSVTLAPAFYKFISSDTSTAIVSETGIVTLVGEGTAKITATLGGKPVKGSLTITSAGDFTLAPTPTRDPNKVTSIFSDHYTNIPVDFFNGFWAPFQTTLSKDFMANGDNILGYTNFNFVGNQFSNPTVDASVKSNLHLNMYIPEAVPTNLDFLITIKDFGADGADGGGDDLIQQVFFKRASFVADKWSTLEIPITLARKNNIGQIIYENVNGSSLKDFYLDNIYFYQQ